jgi:hypothetical protein
LFKNEPLYVLRILDGRDKTIERYFQKTDAKEISNFLYNYIKKQMLDYYCDGCRWCCYGTGTELNKKWCEKRFTGTDDDFNDFYDMCMYKGYPITAYVSRIKFELVPTKDVGYTLEQGETEVWTLKDDFHTTRDISLE